jgi:hypothetical protein
VSPGPQSSLRGVDPAKLDRIVELVRGGATLVAAARAVRLKPKTVQGWVEKGSDDEVPCPDDAVREFAVRVREAQGLCEHDAAQVILRAAKDGDWRAALAYLERVHHERWRPRQEIEQKGEQGVTLLELARAAHEARLAAAQVPPRVGTPEIARAC